ncbi:MAG: OmpA family protein, partial [Syntrophales bacterium]|nr:OmpA family protein [Syntrophales bacterium]
INFNPDGANIDRSALVNYGVGVKYFLTKNIALRGDVRHVIPFDDTYNNLLYTAGLSFFFGGEKKAAAAVAAVAPAPAPKPAPVAAPAPKDSDGDGVYDNADKCPDTPAGARVDNRGCWILHDVLFDFDKAIIKPEGRPILDEAVVVLDNNPPMRVDIQGHTDSVGSDEWNQGLSERRAAAVLEALVSAGIEPARLTAKGFGEGMPAATNETTEGRALNRRVELTPIP